MEVNVIIWVIKVYLFYILLFIWVSRQCFQSSMLTSSLFLKFQRKLFWERFSRFHFPGWNFCPWLTGAKGSCKYMYFKFLCATLTKETWLIKCPFKAKPLHWGALLSYVFCKMVIWMFSFWNYQVSPFSTGLHVVVLILNLLTLCISNIQVCTT